MFGENDMEVSRDGDADMPTEENGMTPTCSHEDLDSLLESEAIEARLVDYVEENVEISEWTSSFMKLTSQGQLKALLTLIHTADPNQVRFLGDTIQRFFQKDIICHLPPEISLKVFTYLEGGDLKNISLVSKSWMMLSEANPVWKVICDRHGIRLPPPTNRVDGAWKQVLSPDSLKVRDRMKLNELIDYKISKIEKKYGRIYERSPYKSLFLRFQRVLNSWRSLPIRGMAVLRGHEDYVITCIQIRGDILVTGADDTTLRVWSIDKGKLLHKLSGHTGGVWTCDISIDGKFVVSGSTDRSVKVWSTETGALLHTLTGHISTVRCTALHANILVSGARDSTLRVWDIQSGTFIRSLHGEHCHLAAVRCVQFDGDLVVSGGYDFTVKVWDVHTGTCIRTLCGHNNRVYSLLFVSERGLIVSGSLDTMIIVWDISRPIGEECIAKLTGHTSLTSGIQLRENILVSSNADGTLRVWDITEGSCVFVLTGHKSAITSMQYLDDNMVVTSSDDGTVKLWDIKKGTYIRDLIGLSSGGNGGCVWRLCATSTLLACAAGSRHNTEETKVVLIDFDAIHP